MKKKITVAVTAVLLLTVCAFAGHDVALTMEAKEHQPLTLVIDAGHGGMDPGASAPDGTSEREINLSVTEKLRESAENAGIKVVLTREDSLGLIPDDSGGKWSKLGDLNVRRDIIEETQPDVVLSIHLNSYTADSSVRGAQVFYAEEASKSLAEAIQESIKTGVDDGTGRIALAKKDMYLFQRKTGADEETGQNERKMILVECGFLSNPQDLANLKTEIHQQKIADSILYAVTKIL